VSKWKDIKEKHAQPNFMIGIGYVNSLVEGLESELNLLKQYYRESQRVVGFYGEGNSHYDAKYEWGEDHNPEVGTETFPSGKRAREFQNSELNKKAKSIVDENGESIGQKQGYTKDQIDMHMAVIKLWAQYEILEGAE